MNAMGCKALGRLPKIVLLGVGRSPSAAAIGAPSRTCGSLRALASHINSSDLATSLGGYVQSAADAIVQYQNSQHDPCSRLLSGQPLTDWCLVGNN